MGKIGETDNNLCADAQRFLYHAIHFFDFLHALIHNDIIECIIRKFPQTAFNIIVKDTQTLLDAFLNGLVVKFDSLCPDMLIPNQGIQKFTFTAAQIQNARIRFNNRIDDLVIQLSVKFHHCPLPDIR
ncbi:MAG: hypothetical protein BWX45_01040 [Deltaproteobacteria bacterium ADurb.Bin002]|nr:MAG: hypothetical protein BWX45_01040 [Deltaproteobacteria bacterium ADurb.Bin002]